ncbi:MAG: hypothetical protein ACLFV5_12395 [Anaerolineales bacterium]
MKKKLALACSLIHEPRVLMLDEPILGVDPISRRECWELIYLMADERMTVLVTPTIWTRPNCASEWAFSARGA